MRIEAITPLDRRRSKVLTDEGFAFVLYRGELKTYGVEEGEALSADTYARILREVLFRRAKERVLYLLQSRDRTEQEIRQKLKEGYYPAEAIEYAVSFLKEYGLVDDAHYGRSYIRTFERKKSRRQLEFELRGKGLDKETASLLLEESRMPEEEKIRQYLKKKGYEKGAATPRQKGKLAAALARRGFSYEEIYSAMGECPEDGFAEIEVRHLT